MGRGGYKGWSQPQPWSQRPWRPGPYNQQSSGNNGMMDMVGQLDNMLGSMRALGTMAQLGQVLATGQGGSGSPPTSNNSQQGQHGGPLQQAVLGQSTAMSESLLNALKGQGTGNNNGSLVQPIHPPSNSNSGNSAAGSPDIETLLASSETIRALSGRMGSLEKQVDAQSAHLTKILSGQDKQEAVLGELLKHIKNGASDNNEEDDSKLEDLPAGVPRTVAKSFHEEWCQVVSISMSRSTASFREFNQEVPQEISYIAWRQKIMKNKNLDQWRAKAASLQVPLAEYEDINELSDMCNFLVVKLADRLREA
eukprot:TRINITY_DN25464_c0_g2_i1.p1 TRINITY_DN25464_c0_g2~~TRINITY_DN25464_c0_g2_i1.p1  ORF type:complete len:361 (+),score=37.95 TRINITY_DN25464_c0_g2_i1:157-1083(+)